jgi:SAM-dependent methyltransferase
MTGSDAARFFDRIAGRYERSYALPAAESRERMQRVLRDLPPPPARVLDLGVGTGRELAALLDAGYEPTGLDASTEMLARCARRSRPVPLVEADFYHPLPFADRSFDAAIALHGSLAHPPDEGAIGRLAQELARVVRPRGVWIAEAPSPAWLANLDRLHPDGDWRVRRTGPETCVYEDEVAGASIEARVLSEGRWREALGDHWVTRVVPVTDVEWFIVARRA